MAVLSPLAREMLERLPDPTRDLPSRWPSAEAAFLTPAEQELVLAAQKEIERGGVDAGMEAFRAFARGRGLRLYEAVVGRYQTVAQFANRADLAAPGTASAPDEAQGVAPLDVETILKSVAKTGRLLIVDESFGHGGSGYMRLNLGAPRALIREATQRIVAAARGKGLVRLST